MPQVWVSGVASLHHPITIAAMGDFHRAVPVEIPGARYIVTVAPGILPNVGEELRRISSAKKAAIVSDSNVYPLHGQTVRRSLEQAGFEVVAAVQPAGEDHKTLSDLLGAYDVLLQARIERSTPILALGGGVTGDMGGFLAATTLRGLPLIQIPTTLLSMVDASVGGKTGVNHAMGKNLIGAFHQPAAVLIDPRVLATLPARELRSGLAECIKHDIIRDAEGFADLERRIERALALDIEYLAELVGHNVAIKARVVAADPLEKGERAHLNFGHTFGHAIERVSDYRYAHGEAVALGMCAAAHAAMSLGLIAQSIHQRIVAVVEKAGLPARGMDLDLNAVADAMFFDKKVSGGRLRFVLPDRLGNVIIRDDLSQTVVKQALESVGR